MWHHHGASGSGGWPNNNLSARIYGYAPDGQITWAARTPDGGHSGSAWENGSGENYGYAANGALSGFGIADLGTYQGANNQGDSAADPALLTDGNDAHGPGSYSSSYQYDPSGNRRQVRQFGGSDSPYTVGPANRYQGSVYDGNGCTTDSALGWTYAYDAEGQLTRATRPSDGATLQFAYDGAGRLVYQSRSGGAATLFCYAGRQRIEERRAADNASLYRYFFDAPGSDSLVFRQQSNGQANGGARLFYQFDAVGNTTHLTDDGGNVVEQYLYDAYGTPFVYDKAGRYLGQTSAQDNRYLFHASSAYQWLAAPQLYSCRARMYLPAVGRWLQPDPSGFAGGDLNLYRYCGNDPVNGCDPSGLMISGWNWGGTVTAGVAVQAAGGVYLNINGKNPLNWQIAVAWSYTPATGSGLIPSASIYRSQTIYPFSSDLNSLQGKTWNNSVSVDVETPYGVRVGQGVAINAPIEPGSSIKDVSVETSTAIKAIPNTIPVSGNATSTVTFNDYKSLGSPNDWISSISNFFKGLFSTDDIGNGNNMVLYEGGVPCGTGEDMFNNIPGPPAMDHGMGTPLFNWQISLRGICLDK